MSTTIRPFLIPISLPIAANNVSAYHLNLLNSTELTWSVPVPSVEPLSFWSIRTPSYSLAHITFLPCHLPRTLPPNWQTHQVKSSGCKPGMTLWLMSNEAWNFRTTIRKREFLRLMAPPHRRGLRGLRLFLRDCNEDDIMVVLHGQFLHHDSRDVDKGG